MKSKITIDVDYDNQPVIKIDYQHSEDVRDRLIKKFLSTFGEVKLATLYYSYPKGTDYTVLVRPIPPEDLQVQPQTTIDGKHYEEQYIIKSESLEKHISQ